MALFDDLSRNLSILKQSTVQPDKGEHQAPIKESMELDLFKLSREVIEGKVPDVTKESTENVIKKLTEMMMKEEDEQNIDQKQGKEYLGMSGDQVYYATFDKGEGAGAETAGEVTAPGIPAMQAAGPVQTDQLATTGLEEPVNQGTVSIRSVKVYDAADEEVKVITNDENLTNADMLYRIVQELSLDSISFRLIDSLGLLQKPEPKEEPAPETPEEKEPRGPRSAEEEMPPEEPASPEVGAAGETPFKPGVPRESVSEEKKSCAVCRADFSLEANADTADKRTLCTACRKAAGKLTGKPLGTAAAADKDMGPMKDLAKDDIKGVGESKVDQIFLKEQEDMGKSLDKEAMIKVGLKMQFPNEEHILELTPEGWNHKVAGKAMNEVAPEGWEGTVKRMKANKKITNPWALAWYMKGKGYKSQKKENENYLLQSYSDSPEPTIIYADKELKLVGEAETKELAEKLAAEHVKEGKLSTILNDNEKFQVYVEEAKVAANEVLGMGTPYHWRKALKMARAKGDKETEASMLKALKRFNEPEESEDDKQFEAKVSKKELAAAAERTKHAMSFLRKIHKATEVGALEPVMDALEKAATKGDIDDKQEERLRSAWSRKKEALASNPKATEPTAEEEKGVEAVEEAEWCVPSKEEIAKMPKRDPKDPRKGPLLLGGDKEDAKDADESKVEELNIADMGAVGGELERMKNKAKKREEKEPEDTELEAATRRNNLSKETEINKKSAKRLGIKVKEGKETEYNDKLAGLLKKRQEGKLTQDEYNVATEELNKEYMADQTEGAEEPKLPAEVAKREKEEIENEAKKDKEDPCRCGKPTEKGHQHCTKCLDKADAEKHSHENEAKVSEQDDLEAEAAPDTGETPTAFENDRVVIMGPITNQADMVKYGQGTQWAPAHPDNRHNYFDSYHNRGYNFYIILPNISTDPAEKICVLSGPEGLMYYTGDDKPMDAADFEAKAREYGIPPYGNAATRTAENPDLLAEPPEDISNEAKLDESMDFYEIGSTPTGEDCVQVNKDADYIDAMRAEAVKYKEMLDAKFPRPEGVNASFKIKTFSHDFGPYIEVVIVYDPDDAQSAQFMNHVEANLPEKWADTEVVSFTPSEEEGEIEEAKKKAKGKGKKWIQKAVDSKHKGFCTPTTKKTCTPRRKALAMRFKKGIEKE